MIFDIKDDGGLIRIGPFSILWQNPDEEYPGFTTLNAWDYGLEFGDIDAGNGIHLTKYADGDIEYTLPIISL